MGRTGSMDRSHKILWGWSWEESYTWLPLAKETSEKGPHLSNELKLGGKQASIQGEKGHCVWFPARQPHQ